jgi:hypothetical protein
VSARKRKDKEIFVSAYYMGGIFVSLSILSARLEAPKDDK